MERRPLARFHITRMIRTTATVTSTAVLTFAGCGGGGGDDDTPAAVSEPSGTTTAGAANADAAPGSRPCSEERHMVVFDFAGVLTVEQDEGALVTEWLSGNPPEPQSGTPELSQAYRDRGYEILYLTAAPPDLVVDGLPVPTAVQEWLRSNGFAIDPDGTSVLGYTGTGDVAEAIVSITDELLRLASEDVQLDAGYTDDEQRVYPLASGGIPAERIYMIGPDAGAAGTTAIPDDDLQAHLATTVQELPPVCTPA